MSTEERPPSVFRIAAKGGEWHVFTAEPAEGHTEYTFTVPRLVSEAPNYPDTSMPPECEGHQCDWRGGPIHVPGCPLYRP